MTPKTTKKNILICIAITSSILLACSLYLFIFPPSIDGQVNNPKKENGYAYVYFIPKLKGLQKYFYQVGKEHVENISKLYIDGTLLEQNNQSYKIIREKGNGRYSLISSTLLFSLPENKNLETIKTIDYEIFLQEKYDILIPAIIVLSLIALSSCLALVSTKLTFVTLALLNLLALAFVIHIYAIPPTMHKNIENVDLFRGYAHSYSFLFNNPLLAYFYEIENNANIQLWIDNELYTQANRSHDSISSLGDGRYSVWNNKLIFSIINNKPIEEVESIKYELQLNSKNTLIIILACTLAIAIFSISMLLKSSLIAKIIIINCMIFGGTILVIGIVGEIYFRTVHDIRPRAWPSIFSPDVGFIFKPHSIIHQTNYINFFQTSITNKDGFSDRDNEPLDDTQKIVFIGDSFVQASEVAHENKSHVILENLLNKDLKNIQHQTFAFGISSTGQANQLAFYDHFAKKLQPNIVVLVIVNNDLGNNHPTLEALRWGTHPNYQHSTSIVKMADDTFAVKPPSKKYSFYNIDEPNVINDFPFSNLFKNLFSSSAFYRYVSSLASSNIPSLRFLTGNTQDLNALLKKRIEALQKNNFSILDGESNLTYADLDLKFNDEKLSPVFLEAVEYTNIALQEWQKRAKRDGFKIVALLSHTVSNYCQEKSLAKDRFAALLSENNIEYVDQCDTIKKSGKPAKDAHFNYDGHWNEQGHIWAADALLPLITKTTKK